MVTENKMVTKTNKARKTKKKLKDKKKEKKLLVKNTTYQRTFLGYIRMVFPSLYGETQ